jgi:capsular polysaccharide biosynthesis protein
MEQNRQYIEEDEIDLKELWKIVVKRKKFIFLFTTILTVLVIAWVLIRTPIYEARALIEIGNYNNNNYNNNNNNNKVILDNASQLVQKLNILFIDMTKNIKDKKTNISSIKVPKDSKEFIEIKSTSTSNELAIKEIQKVINYIQTQHQKILDSIKKERKNSYNITKQQLEKNTKLVQNLNIKDISTVEMLEFLRTKENIGNMITKQNNIKNLLLSHNYKNTKIVGKIIINDYPIKPKKKLMVTVAFVTGLILSIFLVFFLEFIGKSEEETK